MGGSACVQRAKGKRARHRAAEIAIGHMLLSRVRAGLLAQRLASAPRRALCSANPVSLPGIGTYEAVGSNEAHAGKPNKYSAVITQRKTQGAGQAQLFATDVGKVPDGMNKPQVGIASVWYEGNPCNMHLMDVAAAAKRYVQDLGMVGLRFNSIGVSDGISNGTDGMAYSLQSRDLIADGIETVMGAQFYDANLSIPGCDKNMPGCIMAMARVNRPSVMVYGGTIRAGCRPGADEKLDIISAFQAYGEFVAGKVDDATRLDIVRSAGPSRYLAARRSFGRRRWARLGRCARRAPAPARAAACTLPTRWPPPSRPSGWPCRTPRPSRRGTRQPTAARAGSTRRRSTSAAARPTRLPPASRATSSRAT